MYYICIKPAALAARCAARNGARQRHHGAPAMQSAAGTAACGRHTNKNDKGMDFSELVKVRQSDRRYTSREVEEEKSGIRFLRKAVEGVAKSSYGIHVAKIAGLPRSVIKDAKDFQKRHFDLFESISSGQQSLFQGDDEESVYEEAGKEIASFDIDNSTPMEAFLFIRELKKMLEGKQ